VLSSNDLERTRNFYRYFGFEAVEEPGGDDRWLTLRKGDVEIDFSLAEVDHRLDEYIRFQRMCIIRVRDVAAWHASFADTRMGWKVIFPSLTRPRDDMWGGVPAFSITDRDGNLIWCVQDEEQG
jgi:catechol 2,3-dioxygenase-like lactoylglutathione lyase family enzyme